MYKLPMVSSRVAWPEMYLVYTGYVQGKDMRPNACERPIVQGGRTRSRTP